MLYVLTTGATLKIFSRFLTCYCIRGQIFYLCFIISKEYVFDEYSVIQNFLISCNKLLYVFLGHF